MYEFTHKYMIVSERPFGGDRYGPNYDKFRKFGCNFPQSIIQNANLKCLIYTLYIKFGVFIETKLDSTIITCKSRSLFERLPFWAQLLFSESKRAIDRW